MKKAISKVFGTFGNITIAGVGTLLVCGGVEMIKAAWSIQKTEVND